MPLRRFWIELQPQDGCQAPLRTKFGVTAWSLEDAMAILRETTFADGNLPLIESVVPDVDVSTLDAGHIQPNMGVSARRGIWYPLGHELDLLPPPPPGWKPLV